MAHLLTSFTFKLQHNHVPGRATNDQRLTQCTQVQLVNSQARVVTEWVIDSHLHIQVHTEVQLVNSQARVVTEWVIDSHLHIQVDTGKHTGTACE